MVKQEITGWRDLEMSQRHRSYGFDCPMFDLDFIGVEYDNAIPVCLVEFKQVDTTVDVKSANIRTLINLGNTAGLPVFLTQYSVPFYYYMVSPLNDLAKTYVKVPTTMTEVNWVTLLYKLRGRNVPEGILKGLHGR